MKKYRELIILGLAGILMAGCQADTKQSGETVPAVAEAVETETPKLTPSAVPEETASEVPVETQLETPVAEEEAAVNPADFKTLDKAGNLIFNIKEKQKDTLVKFLPEGSEETIQVKAKEDGKSAIEMMYEEKIYEFEHVENIYYIDLDEKDEEKELVITGMGDGGNPCTQIIKATSEGLVVLRKIDDDIQVDQKGHITQALSQITFSPEPIIGMVYNVKENYIKKEIIFDNPQNFTLTEEVTVDFTPEDKTKESGIQSFKAGTAFNVTDYLGNFKWQVEIDGVKGTMCLQIAG